MVLLPLGDATSLSQLKLKFNLNLVMATKGTTPRQSRPDGARR
jgi:hypothetical protein